ncbi:MAG: hypothetical protein WCE81_05780 [Halobacteriota archaeon]
MSAISSKMLITVIIELLILPLVFFLAAGTLSWFLRLDLLDFALQLLFSHCSMGAQEQSWTDKGALDRVQT